jgi:hypothetical protein
MSYDSIPLSDHIPTFHKHTRYSSELLTFWGACLGCRWRVETLNCEVDMWISIILTITCTIWILTAIITLCRSPHSHNTHWCILLICYLRKNSSGQHNTKNVTQRSWHNNNATKNDGQQGQRHRTKILSYLVLIELLSNVRIARKAEDTSSP